MCRQKKSSFLGSPRDVFRRPSAAPEPIAPKFLHTTFPSKYFVLAEFHPPRLSFGGVMQPTPSGASLHYGLPYSIWQAIINEMEQNTDRSYQTIPVVSCTRTPTSCIDKLTRGQSNLTKSASRGAHSPVRGHPRGSKVVPLNSWGRVSY